jgi:hypothetical protein
LVIVEPLIEAALHDAVHIAKIKNASPELLRLVKVLLLNLPDVVQIVAVSVGTKKEVLPPVRTVCLHTDRHNARGILLDD